MKKAIICSVCVFILIYLICTPFRGKGTSTQETSYKLVQAYINTGIIKSAPLRDISCPNQGENVFLLIMVPSAVSNFDQRVVIRRTWGNTSNAHPGVQLRFVIGRSKNQALQDLVRTEKFIYNDIIVEDIVETYENLTRKSIAILHWVASFCNRVRYLLKIDDDMFLNVPRLIKHLMKDNPTNSILGCKVSHSSPFRLYSKWSVSWDDYKEKEYPEYISGTAYLISGDIVTKLYQATQQVPYFMFEDVFVTGLCRRHIGAVPIGHPEFTCGYRDRGPCGSNYRYRITGHHYSPSEVTRMWAELQDRWSDCRLVDYYLIYILVDTFKWIFL
jgi:beta-1,3-galactosyltransferase 1